MVFKKPVFITIPNKCGHYISVAGLDSITYVPISYPINCFQKMLESLRHGECSAYLIGFCYIV